MKVGSKRDVKMMNFTNESCSLFNKALPSLYFLPIERSEIMKLKSMIIENLPSILTGVAVS